jgi:uncharacterized protein HemX
MEHECKKEKIIEDLKQLTYKQETKIAVLESNVEAVKEDISNMKADIKTMSNKTNYILVSVILVLIAAIVNIALGVK